MEIECCDGMGLCSIEYMEPDTMQVYRTLAEEYTYKTYISETMECIKPSKPFFEYVIQDLKCNPNQCLMIGDSLTNDIEGAKAAGMDVCFYNLSDKVLKI